LGDPEGSARLYGLLCSVSACSCCRGPPRARLLSDNARMGSDEDAQDFIVVGEKVALPTASA